MVAGSESLYLLIGQEPPAKENILKPLKDQFLKNQTRQFNLDILYGRNLSLKQLQERLLVLPLDSPKRLVIVKEAECLNEELKAYLLQYVKSPLTHVLLVLDAQQEQQKNNQSKKEAFSEFADRLSRYVRVFRAQVPAGPDAFGLGREIQLRRIPSALSILHQLLDAGQRPERILGGLRYSCEREAAAPAFTRKKLKYLLRCDIEMKTGRAKPLLALEKLVVRLCCL